MANVDRPNGLRPVKHLDGSPFNGLVNKYFVPATDNTAIFPGDAVKSAGSADERGIPTVAQAAAGNAILGVVVSVVPETDESLQYRAASTARYVLVADSPDIIFEIQEDSVGGALTADDVGLNADIVVGTGNTDPGTSAMELDSDTKLLATGQLRILRLSQREDNEIGVNALWEVMINEHEHKQIAGV